ncbi:MAG: putative permease [Betaproteobacteria bacterium]|nr:putative permease [Betaproteobacteria bacterium]
MWFDLALIALGGFIAAMVVGSAGFAFAIVVTGVWLYVLPPVQIVLLASVCATALHTVSIWQFRRDIELRLLWPFVLGGALGVPLGVLALKHLDPRLFRHLFGAFMIAYSCYMLRRPHMPVVKLTPAIARVADAAVGWVSGILGGFALLQGTLPTIWCSLRGWDKRRSRTIYQPYILITGVLAMLWVGSTVQIDKSELMLPLAVCLPAMGLGLWVGMRLFEVISEERFRRLVLWLILVSGISLQF